MRFKFIFVFANGSSIKIATKSEGTNILHSTFNNQQRNKQKKMKNLIILAVALFGFASGQFNDRILCLGEVSPIVKRGSRVPEESFVWQASWFNV